jgi:hypothetical protein
MLSIDRWLIKRRIAHSCENCEQVVSPEINRNMVSSHLKDAQGSEILPRWLSPGVIEQIDGGNDDGYIATRFALCELSDRLEALNYVLSVALKQSL